MTLLNDADTALGVILVHIFPHLDQNNSEYGHFLRRVVKNLTKI